MPPGPGLGKSGEAIDRDDVDPVLNGEVWFCRRRHSCLQPRRVHSLLPYGHLSQSLETENDSISILLSGLCQSVRF